MLSFNFYCPTRYIFGKDAMDFFPDALREQNAKRVMVVHYGERPDMATPINAVNAVRESLTANGFEFIEFAGVVPNPVLSRVMEGIEVCREYKPDLILAIGGGSTIDTAKAIAAGVMLEEGEDLWNDYIFPKARFKKAVPVAVILTIPAAGSEMSFGICITDEKTKTKRYTGGECLIPKFCISNPEFCYTLPPYQTACGVFDIVSHLTERYFVPFPDEDLSDHMIEAIIKTLLVHGPKVMADPENYGSRSQIMWAGTIAHNKILEMGRTHGDWACHDMGHELSSFYDMTHGASLAIITPAWMKYVYKRVAPENKGKFLQYARNVFGVTDIGHDREDDTIEEMIRRLEQWIKAMGLPTRLSEAGIGDEDFEAMAENAMRGRKNVGTGWGIHLLYKDDVVNVYNLAK